MKILSELKVGDWVVVRDLRDQSERVSQVTHIDTAMSHTVTVAKLGRFKDTGEGFGKFMHAFTLLGPATAEQLQAHRDQEAEAARAMNERAALRETDEFETARLIVAALSSEWNEPDVIVERIRQVGLDNAKAFLKAIPN